MTNASQPQPACPADLSINRVVAMVHVADVDAAARFYGWLGFEIDSRYARADGVTNFVGLTSGAARLFLTRASGPIVPSQQAVLFYMYAPDVARLRAHLLQQGLQDGGIPPGFRSAAENEQLPERNLVHSICYPFYMPCGELRVQDLDGYTLLIGQLG